MRTILRNPERKHYNTITPRIWLLFITGHLDLNRLTYVIYVGFVLLLQLILISSALATIFCVTLTKELFVQTLHTLMLLLYSICILSSRICIDGPLRKTKDFLNSGIFEYKDEAPDEYIHHVLKATEKQIKKRSDSFAYLMGFSGFSNTFLFPLTQLLLIHEETPDSPLNPYLAHPLYLPFNSRTTLGFTVGFILNGLVLVNVYGIVITTNDIYQLCTGTLKSHFEILNYSLQNIETRACKMYRALQYDGNELGHEELFNKEGFRKCLYACLKSNVKHHLSLVKFRNTFQVYTGTTLFVMVTVATFVLGTVLSLLLQNPPLNTAINYLLTLVAEIGYPLYLCYCGEDVLNESGKVFESLYSTPWIYCDEKFKKIILIMMANSRAPLKIKTRVINLTASLETFGIIPTTTGWKKIENGFREQWNFPGCCGAIDGKHVVIKAPPESGSLYYNYKETNSIVLMAVVDDKYCFSYIDVGCNGRVSDGGVFRNCSLYQELENGVLPEGHVLVGDNAFPLKEYLLKPFPGNRLTLQQKNFNYRLSRARRIVENAFGILAARFRVFEKPMPYSPEKVVKIVKTCCALHNWLRQTKLQNKQYEYTVDTENYEAGAVLPGNWRNEPESLGMQPLPISLSNRSSQRSIDRREKYANYFVGSGSVPWQTRMIH